MVKHQGAWQPPENADCQASQNCSENEMMGTHESRMTFYCFCQFSSRPSLCRMKLQIEVSVSPESIMKTWGLNVI